MLILPPKEKMRKEIEAHEQARESLTTHFNTSLEKILNENSKKEKYWVLGKVRFPEELGGKIGRTFLEASDSKPPVIKDAFLYEVDNTKGVKHLLWVCHPNGDLRLPTLGKTVRINSASS